MRQGGNLLTGPCGICILTVCSCTIVIRRTSRTVHTWIVISHCVFVGHRKNVNFVQKDVTTLEYSDNSFDLIFSCWILMYLTDPEVSCFVSPHFLHLLLYCYIHVQWIPINPPQFVLKNIGGLMSLADYPNHFAVFCHNSCAKLMADKRVWRIKRWRINVTVYINHTKWHDLELPKTR